MKSNRIRLRGASSRDAMQIAYEKGKAEVILEEQEKSNKARQEACIAGYAYGKSESKDQYYAEGFREGSCRGYMKGGIDGQALAFKRVRITLNKLPLAEMSAEQILPYLDRIEDSEVLLNINKAPTQPKRKEKKSVLDPTIHIPQEIIDEAARMLVDDIDAYVKVIDET